MTTRIGVPATLSLIFGASRVLLSVVVVCLTMWEPEADMLTLADLPSIAVIVGLSYAGLADGFAWSGDPFFVVVSTATWAAFGYLLGIIIMRLERRRLPK
jgi:hypothetical protein